MATTKVWSERPEPNAPGLRDCTYSAGLTGLVFAGFDKFPKGAFTVDEREALERSDDQPNETGASLDDLILAIKRRYDITLKKSLIQYLAQHKARADLGFVIQGANGNLPYGHTLRRWDKNFTGGHAVFINPSGDGSTVHWYDPEAPMGFAGDIVNWATVTKWIGNAPYFISLRDNQFYVAPPAPPVPPAPPATYTEAEYKAAITARDEAINKAVALNTAIDALEATLASRELDLDDIQAILDRQHTE